jgi:hypothetical protein
MQGENVSLLSARSHALKHISLATVAFSTVMLTASSARAQGRLFIDGSAAMSMFAGPFAGGAVAGVVLSPRYDVRLEVEIAQWRVDRVSERSSIGSFDFTDGFRPASYSVLFGRRLYSKRRAELEILIGAGVVRQSWTQSGHDDFRVNGVVTHEFSWNDHGTTTDPQFTAGLEASVWLTPHLAIVPRWRSQLYGASAGGTSGGYYLPTTTLRNVAGVAVRWKF